ncbi:MAG: hypothetical protein BWX92_03844 [Deltaproteobacteria bacterium ADurb.Bin135]|jgi:hypothetical protein|nr:MAG: hypothetical protein BWX92_03844 [Deltaproteobacteria bacterium ADurb.Bin135]
MLTEREDNLEVVRLSTEYYKRGRNFYYSRVISPLTKLSKGWGPFEDEVSNVGVREAMESLINLSECADGIYKVVTCNESQDWETGIVDDYDLMLVEYVDQT